MDVAPGRWGDSATWSVAGAAAVLAAPAQVLVDAVWSSDRAVEWLWLPGPVVLCLLLLSGRNRWAACIGGALFGCALVCALRDVPMLPACVVLFGELGCVAAAAHLLLRARDDPAGAWIGGGDVVRFLLVAGVLLPAIGAAWHLAASQQLRADLGAGAWDDLTLARALGYLLLVPPALLLLRGARLLREARASLESANARLRALARVTLQVQEEERSRIARDLHDDISQSLAAISIEMSALRRTLHGAEQARADEIQEGLLAVSEDVRRLSHDLHPSMLRYTSLAASLAALCEAHTLHGGLRVVCDARADLALSEAQKLNLFRIAQEGIHNVERHARARVARVSLSAANGDVLLRVEDDGIGLAGDFTLGASHGLGMVSIGERMRLLGGRFTLSRCEGGGTLLEARCPLRRTTEAP